MPKRVTEKDIVVSGAVPARHKPATTKRVKRTAPIAAAEETVTQTVPEIQAPSQEQIAALAYSYWEARGCQGGSAEEDWLRAEGVLLGTSAAIA